MVLVDLLYRLEPKFLLCDYSVDRRLHSSGPTCECPTTLNRTSIKLPVGTNDTDTHPFPRGPCVIGIDSGVWRRTVRKLCRTHIHVHPLPRCERKRSDFTKVGDRSRRDGRIAKQPRGGTLIVTGQTTDGVHP